MLAHGSHASAPRIGTTHQRHASTHKNAAQGIYPRGVFVSGITWKRKGAAFIGRAMERSALLPERAVGFRILKLTLGKEPGSKQASDSNNALRSIAIGRVRRYRESSGIRAARHRTCFMARVCFLRSSTRFKNLWAESIAVTFWYSRRCYIFCWLKSVGSKLRRRLFKKPNSRTRNSHIIKKIHGSSALLVKTSQKRLRGSKSRHSVTL